jgi:hypothetical protein
LLRLGQAYRIRDDDAGAAGFGGVYVSVKSTFVAAPVRTSMSRALSLPIVGSRADTVTCPTGTPVIRKCPVRSVTA